MSPQEKKYFVDSWESKPSSKRELKVAKWNQIRKERGMIGWYLPSKLEQLGIPNQVASSNLKFFDEIGGWLKYDFDSDDINFDKMMI